MAEWNKFSLLPPESHKVTRTEKKKEDTMTALRFILEDEKRRMNSN